MYLSELLAIAAAACIALSGMLIGELKGRVPLLVLTRWQMIASFAMTGAASLVTGGWRTIEPWQAGSLALSGLFGIIIASTTYFAAIYIAGARRTALLFSLSAPFAVLFGYLWLGETVTGQQGAGIALVLAGVVLAIGGPKEGKGRDLVAAHSVGGRLALLGIALGVVTAVGQALGSLAARPAMAAGAEPFTAMAIRSGIAAVFFVALSALPIPGLKSATSFTMRTRLIAFGAAFFGIGLGMSLLMAALVNGNVGIVSTLSSLTPVLILPMVWVRTGHAPSASAWGGAILAVAGIALISL
ncbi:DMT family transporter [Mycoplana ramosa]|uniref:DMT family transporter n=1 Tax=Mycoplana ramosa TaxID=40837 RepID=A0ABW3YYP3_MYCRA